MSKSPDQVEPSQNPSTIDPKDILIILSSGAFAGVSMSLFLDALQHAITHSDSRVPILPQLAAFGAATAVNRTVEKLLKERKAQIRTEVADEE
jgi:hypothetical protein